MNNESPEGHVDHYEVITQKDEETGDVLLPIPQHLLKQLGWKNGDDIESVSYTHLTLPTILLV